MLGEDPDFGGDTGYRRARLHRDWSAVIIGIKRVLFITPLLVF